MKIYAGIIAVSSATLILACASSLRATGVGGYYETEFIAREASDFRWNVASPKHYFQAKIWANPFSGADLYSQFSARTDEDWNDKQFLAFERGWGKWWFGAGEIYFLVKEERHWIDTPLIKVADQGKSSYFNDGAGARLNIFRAGPFYANTVFTKAVRRTRQEWYGNYFDADAQNVIARLGADFRPRLSWFDRFVVGGTYAYTETVQQKYSAAGAFIDENRLDNNVLSLDAKASVGPASLSAQWAVSEKNGSASSPLPGQDRTAASCEARDINISPFRLQAKYYDYGAGFRSELSRVFGRVTRDGNDADKEFGRRGYYFENQYLWPGKMITFVYRRGDYQSSFDYLTNNQDLREDYVVYYSTEKYSVVYDAVESRVDFANGIKNKTAFEVSRNRSGTWPGFLFELSGDTRDIYSRIQYRVKDAGSESGLGERRILGAEARYNISEKVQFFARAVAVDASRRGKNWSSAFFQLRYFVGWDVEGYLEYGEGWHGDLLAYDSDIADCERNTADVAKIIFKLQF